MGKKVEILNLDNGGKIVLIHCPGCNYGHGFYIGKPSPNGSMWKWNGDEYKPTFEPSILVNKDRPDMRCHSFVRNGQIQFLGDCFHSLKNTTVELPDAE